MIDPVAPKQATELLRAHDLRPQKRLGQNFLVDRNTLDRIVRAANLTSDDPVVEIGGGLGALTLALSDVSPSVTTVEIDRHLEPVLREVTQGRDNIHLVFADFLQKDSTGALFDQAFGEKQGVVVANIPYYITTPILERLIEHKSRVKRIVLLVQQEFAGRAVAREDTDEYGAMSVYVQYHTRPEIVGTVPRTVFLPPPEVGSAILALDPVMPATVIVRDEQRFFNIVRSGFAQRRKTLLNALLRAPASFSLGFGMDDRPLVENLLAQAGIAPTRRGETLSVAEFARLADVPVPERESSF